MSPRKIFTLLKAMVNLTVVVSLSCFSIVAFDESAMVLRLSTDIASLTVIVSASVFGSSDADDLLGGFVRSLPVLPDFGSLGGPEV